jgi:phosphoenolpyruvate phosphomutase
VLAAGFQEELLPLISDRPKSMLDIKGKSILERQIETFNQLQIKDIAVVRGYKGDRIQLPNIRTYDNPDFASTGELASLFLASAELNGRVILTYGDILVDRAIVEKLMASPADISIVADRSWRDTRDVRKGGRPDLVIESQAPPQHYRYLPDDHPLGVRDIGQNLDPETATGEFIGMVMLTAKGCEIFRQVHDELVAAGGRVHESASIETAKLTDLLHATVERGHEVASVGVYKGWIEIDTFEDYQRAWAQVAK